MYVNIGQTISDCCGHEHSTRDEAEHCLAEHLVVQRKKGRVSNRRVVEIDSLGDLDEVL